jgi:tetratricopeptide (TPR) repeat protein
LLDADLVLIHGFWSSPATWDRLTARMREDAELRDVHIHAFGYESPKLRMPGSPARIPDYNDIAQSLPAYLAAHTVPTAPLAIVTHSQGGLILQRYLAWMLNEGRGRELARIRLVVMLSCPNEGSEYLRSIRAVTGFGHHPQAGQLEVLDREVGAARRIVLRQIVNAQTLDDRHCPIPVYVYSGRTDNVVLRESAQSVFPNAEVLPGDHFTILDPAIPGHLTFPTIKRHLLAIARPLGARGAETASQATDRIHLGSVPAQVEAFQERAPLGLLAAARAPEGNVPVVQALIGPRGAGKSQLAAAYVRRRLHEDWPLVAWIAAETRDRLLVGLSELATEAGVADPDGDSEVSARRARQFLGRYDDKALIVFDNAEDVDLVREFTPSTGSVQVVITSSHHSFKHVGRVIEVEAFTESESLAFLRERTGLEDLSGAKALIKEADGLPLALAQMASVIERQRLSYGTYLARFRSMPLESLSRSAGDPYPLAAPAAILLSVRAFEADDAEDIRRRTLAVLSLLSPEGVSRTFLHALGVEGVPVDAAATVPVREVAAVDDALAALVESSLGLFSVTGDKMSLHRLIARVVREREQMSGELPRHVQRAADLLAPYFLPPGITWEDWTGVSPLIDEAIENADALWGNLTLHSRSPDAEMSEPVLRLRVASVGYLGWAADARRAVRLGEAVLKDCTTLLGPENLVTLTAQHYLAAVYRQRGQLRSAERMFDQTLRARSRVLGADHPYTLSTLDNLALTYRNMGRLAESADLHRQAIDSRTRTLGPDHPATLGSRHNLAYTYRLQGHLDEAIDLYGSTLASRRAVLGPEHRDTLDSQSCLASAYRQAGRIAEAIELYRLAVVVLERVAGAEDPRTIGAQNDLALAYRAAGQIALSVELHSKCADQFKRILGEDHPHTLSCQNDLAFAYHSLGRYAEAVALREELLPKYGQELGPDHPDTLTCQHDLAWSYRMLGRVSDAVSLHEKTLADRTRVLGPEHPATLSTEEHLGLSLLAAGTMPDALAPLDSAWTKRRQFLGPEHPQTLTSGNSLALGYRTAGRLDEALALQEGIIEVRVRVLGAEHSRTILAKVEFAEMLRQKGESQRAVEELERVRDDASRVLGAEHPYALHAQHALGLSYGSASRWSDAIMILERAADARARVLGPANPDTLRSRLALACAYAEGGQRRRAVAVAREVADTATGSLDPAHPLVTIARECESSLQHTPAGTFVTIFKA